MSERMPPSAGCYRRRGCCSSRSPDTRGLPRSARKSAIRRARSPRAIPLALGITLAVYVVAVAVLTVLGTHRLADTTAPLSDVVRAAGADWLAPVVRVGAAVAALGSLLALILGVSRTTLAMARDRHLPHALAEVHPRFKVPHRAELVVGTVVAVIAATADVRGAIGFSSFGALAFALPATSVISGAAVLALGAAAYGLRRALAVRRSP